MNVTIQPTAQCPQEIKKGCARCAICAIERETATPRPHGWKAFLNGQLVCNRCLATRFHMRAVRFPIQFLPDAPRSEAERASYYQRFHEDLKFCFRNGTRAKNLMVGMMFSHDVASAEDGQLPDRYRGPDPYTLINDRFGDAFVGQKGTLSSLARVVYRTYIRCRQKVLYGEESLPIYRFPQPWPIRRQNWEPFGPELTEDGAPMVTLLVNGNRYRAVLRVRGFERQLASYERILANRAVPCELNISLGRNPANRGVTFFRRGQGGQRHRYPIIVTLATYLPFNGEQRGQTTGVLKVQTTRDHLLRAAMPGDNRCWELNRDDIARLIMTHRDDTRRLSEDAKAERSLRRQARGKREERCRRHGEKMATIIHQCAAAVVNYAVRRRVSRIVYDDQIACLKFPSFPYYRLGELIEQKAVGAGLQFSTLIEERRGAAEKRATQRLRAEFAALERVTERLNTETFRDDDDDRT